MTFWVGSFSSSFLSFAVPVVEQFSPITFWFAQKATVIPVKSFIASTSKWINKTT